MSVLCHVGCSLLVLTFANRHLARHVSQTNDVAINIFNERFKIKKGLDSVVYCFWMWTLQYGISKGFADPCWIVFMAYSGFLVYRVYGWLETFVPVILRPFPYVNL